MENKVKELERITRIAHGKIPVSEESSVFNLFAERREVCRSLLKNITDLERNLQHKVLNRLEDNIKLYLCLL
jgi:hypothetical protein